MTEPIYTTLVEGPDPTPGTLVRSDIVTATDPRRMPVCDIIMGRAAYELGPIVTGTQRPGGMPIPVPVHVEPLGPVTRIEGHDGATLGYECWEGWKVTGRAPLDGLLGPQAETIIEAVKLAEAVLDGTDGDDRAARYYELAADTSAPMEEARVAAIGALDNAGIDGAFWSHAFTCNYGEEIVAFAAFDLLGSTTTWNRDTFDRATAPWRAAFPNGPGTGL